ncbi:amidohydrolase family protein [Parahaliea maris]|uniref:Amidohydrolase family protein n=1 Tax=Parahaliea maris TaxID=2716870 RepID=A0A5C8ZZC4_9GAMM|nr:amidohydrolase family protein [Parahaliea maris]TXS93846.1 amidohydrolase family protein [Parahaliea maris]
MKLSQKMMAIAATLLLCYTAHAGQLAIVGVTVIDGNGGKPLADATVLVDGERITAVDKRSRVNLPEGVTRVDGRGKFLVPGFIDSNVHASVYGNSRRRETVTKYHHRSEELIAEFVQLQLKHGVTTIRDSYGALIPLMAVRDRIARGEEVGPRMLVAGNILGWGGPFSMTFSLMQESELTLFQQQWNDYIAQGSGEELMDMEPAELWRAVNAYLDKGPNFIKYGGTSHFNVPSLIGFSPRAQKVIVEAGHARGLVVETHSTSPEGLRLSVEAGIDLIQHPEMLTRDYSDELLELVVDSGALCAMRPNVYTGPSWQAHLARREAALSAQADLPPPRTSAEHRQREAALGRWLQIQRDNALRLIRAGCPVTIATDNYQGSAPEFRKAVKNPNQEPGIGSLIAIEGLVELGMSESEALVAATRNGARAARMLEDIGTLEAGKVADMLLLDANPLVDIRNIRQQAAVFARGQLIDTDQLPEQAIFSAPGGELMDL